jgi:glycosyltransferase involved in cell wall biosynthesis
VTAATDPPRISLVIPCFNEEDVLPIAARTLAEELAALVRDGLITPASRIVFVDDGSADRTWEIISSLAQSGGPYSGIRLTRNFGHQYALYAGLMLAPGDALVSLDADLQDDVSAIRDMVLAFKEGKDIVYGVRSDCTTDSSFKRVTASLHYKLSRWLGVETVPNHADFRLMSRRAINLLGQYRESNLYLRGMVPLLGLPTGVVTFKREARAGGQSKYSLAKMISLSVRGLTSFSIMPLRMISVLGLVVFAVSMVMGVWAFIAAVTGLGVVPGWASTVIPVYILGGFQLLALGVVGEYIGKTYMEVKRRPLFLVQETRALEAPARDSIEATILG